MSKIGSLLVTIAAVACLSGLSPAAYPAPIVANAGDIITFNFDFVASAASPAPPYTDITVTTGVRFNDGGDVGNWTWFTELDAQGSAADTAFGVDLGGTLRPQAGFVDGVFSFQLVLTAGSISVDPFAIGNINDAANRTGDIFPVSVIVSSIPEPSALALLGIGLAGLGFSRLSRIAR